MKQSIEKIAREYADRDICELNNNADVSKKYYVKGFLAGVIHAHKQDSDEIGESRVALSEALSLFAMINNADDLLFYNFEIEEFKTKAMKILTYAKNTSQD